jgi:hypothetical protein
MPLTYPFDTDIDRSNSLTLICFEFIKRTSLCFTVSSISSILNKYLFVDFSPQKFGGNADFSLSLHRKPKALCPQHVAAWAQRAKVNKFF